MSALLIAAMLSALGLAPANELPEEPSRPNVVLILADDLGFGDLGVYNADSKIETPHLDSLAVEGLRFTDAHSPSAVCTPTRYGILTGRYAWRTELKSSVLMGFSPPLIESDRFTMADLFKGAGYQTACIGKWHLGLGWQLVEGGTVKERYLRDATKVDLEAPFTGGPLELGFDRFFGCSACPTTDWIYSFLEGDRTVGLPSEAVVFKTSEHAEMPGGWYRDGIATPGWEFEQVDPTFVSEACAWLAETNREEPFFLYLPLSAPHAPWLPPEETRGKTEEGARGDMVALVDWAVGEVRAQLEEQELLDDTLIIFTSDNGPRIGLNGHASAGPWRGYKSHTWEGGHRVPLIARWPRKVPADSVYSDPASLTDLLSSFAAILDTELPEGAAEDSIDLSRVLLGDAPREPLREVVISHSVSGAFTIRRGRWKLILGTEGSGGWVAPSDSTDPSDESIGQLYDLQEDPGETTDRFDEEVEVVGELRALLDAARGSSAK